MTDLQFFAAYWAIGFALVAISIASSSFARNEIREVPPFMAGGVIFIVSLWWPIAFLCLAIGLFAKWILRRPA